MSERSIIYISHTDDKEHWWQIHKMLEDQGHEVVNDYIDLKNKEIRPIDYLKNVIDMLFEADVIYMMGHPPDGKLSKLGQLEIALAEHIGLEQC